MGSTIRSPIEEQKSRINLVSPDEEATPDLQKGQDNMNTEINKNPVMKIFKQVLKGQNNKNDLVNGKTTGRLHDMNNIFE
mmetsp:Transcript_27861/g.24654  ORF Transcript_27861/g.24654 Transcript_27861/m.24654 type:complete len:80 (+) Transcript_27861:141-380(+)